MVSFALEAAHYLWQIVHFKVCDGRGAADAAVGEHVAKYGLLWFYFLFLWHTVKKY